MVYLLSNSRRNSQPAHNVKWTTNLWYDALTEHLLCLITDENSIDFMPHLPCIGTRDTCSRAVEHACVLCTRHTFCFYHSPWPNELNVVMHISVGGESIELSCQSIERNDICSPLGWAYIRSLLLICAGARSQIENFRENSHFTHRRGGEFRNCKICENHAAQTAINGNSALGGGHVLIVCANSAAAIPQTKQKK